jgi:cytochrome c556
MTRRCGVLLPALLSMALLVVACGGSSQPAAPPAPQAQPAAAPAADVGKHMEDHFARVHEIEMAVIRGDLEAVKGPATWLADHQTAAGLPAGSDAYVTDMKRASSAVAAAESVDNAAAATANMVASCGACHAGTKVTPKMPDLVEPTIVPGTASHMLQHQYAVDQLYEGLAAPSSELWMKGAASLKASPLAYADLPKDTKVGQEIMKFETRVHELADRAEKATDQGARTAIYGELIGGCANCHGLHGGLWGPGLPKDAK